MIDSHHRPTPSRKVARGARTDSGFVVVAGLDGSDDCVEIARISTALAAGLGGRVALVHVPGRGSRLPTAFDVEDERTQARAMLDGLRDSADYNTSAELTECGDPARRIAAVAGSAEADVIVVGTRGKARVDAAVGGVSTRLAADAPCPVLVVPTSLRSHVRPRTWWGRTIVCGFDGSAAAWTTAFHAAMLAARLRGTVRLVSVGDAVPWRMSEVVGELTSRLRVLDEIGPPALPTIDWEVRSGDPAFELERVASAITSPLIAIGSRGAGPRTDALLGSVARRLLLAGRRPTLVVPALSTAPWPAQMQSSPHGQVDCAIFTMKV